MTPNVICSTGHLKSPNSSASWIHWDVYSPCLQWHWAFPGKPQVLLEIRNLKLTTSMDSILIHPCPAVWPSLSVPSALSPEPHRCPPGGRRSLSLACPPPMPQLPTSLEERKLSKGPGTSGINFRAVLWLRREVRGSEVFLLGSVKP